MTYRFSVESSASLELTEIIPLAMVIALSPLSIIPAVLVLQSPRPRPTGLAFLAGWVAGLAVLTALFSSLSGLFGGHSAEPPAWTSRARIVVGAALIVWGVARWLNRHNNAHDLPGTKHIVEAGPRKALVVGAALTVVNPKVLFICLAAGMALGTSTVGNGLFRSATVFVIVSASTVALPILAYAVSGVRLRPTLERIKAWMDRHNAGLLAVILIAIGLMVLYKGIHGL
jgi:hypothetical protein